MKKENSRTQSEVGQQEPSEVYYRGILQTTMDGFWLLDIQGKIMDVNDAYCRMSGYSRDELLQLKISDLDCIEDPQTTAERIERVIKKGSEFFPSKHRKKDGSVLEMEISTTYTAQNGGGFICFCRDITDTVRIESELKKTESELENTIEMFSQFIHNSPVYVFIKEVSPTQSKVIQASENYMDMIGIPGSQMIGKTMPELFPSEFAEKITADDWDVVSKGEIFNEEETLNGRTYTTIKFPIRLSDKQLLAGYTIDITEQKAVEEALRSSEERYHLIDEASQDMIYSYDQDGRFTHANTYMCLQLKLSPEQILGRTHEELGYPQELCDEWAALHRRVYETNATVIEETTSIMPDGTRKHFEVVLNPMHDAHGKIIGIAGTTRDIHARKLAEAKIREQLDELNRWHKITMGREQRILELKQEVNELMIKLGKAPKYGSVDEG